MSAVKWCYRRGRCWAGLPELTAFSFILQATGNFVIEGEFLVQVDELFDINLPLRERYSGTNPRRMFKIALHDGGHL